MEKRIKIIGLVALLAAFMVGARAREATPAPPPKEVKSTLAPAGKIWQKTWDQWVAAGKQEGKVVIYNDIAPAARIEVAKAFKQKYGINLDFVTGRGAALATKLKQEQTAGLFLADIFCSGPSTAMQSLRPYGILTPLKPLLLLPEVVDPKKWNNGAGLEFADKGEPKYVVTPFLNPAATIFRNSDLVKEGELKSLDDLLHPKWKGKIVMNDPTMKGTGLKFFRVAEMARGADYLRKLTGQLALVSRDERLLTETVARGKYAIVIAIPRSQTVDFIRAGAPLRPVSLDYEYLNAKDALSVLAKAPHPNATRVFVNWWLAGEAQTIHGIAGMMASTRVDFPLDKLPADFLRKPGIHYLKAYTEEYYEAEIGGYPLAGEIFKPLLR